MRSLTLTALSVALAAGGAHAMTETTRLTTPSGELFGTLELPDGAKGPVPIALLISGSGPTDRDGNSAALPGKNDGLKQLAEALAKRGIASLRYDKRGVGESQAAVASVAADSALAFRTEVNDVAGWIERLKADGRFSGVVVMGHSQGSLTGMLAIQQAPAAAFVSLEGAGENVYDTLKRQLSGQLPPAIMGPAQGVLDEFRAGRTVPALPAELAAVPALAATFALPAQGYVIEWMRHDPAAVLAGLKLPALVVLGTTDDRLTSRDLERLAGARPGVKSAVIEGMSHPLKSAVMTQESQLKAYTDASVPLAPGLVDALEVFIKANVK